ncbi:MAG: hypothetical protein JRN08_08865 [Nitrososphaerota archaeon]|nr:hypothetical protein [Nitrososphaerota archaeon]
MSELLTPPVGPTFVLASSVTSVPQASSVRAELLDVAAVFPELSGRRIGLRTMESEGWTSRLAWRIIARRLRERDPLKRPRVIRAAASRCGRPSIRVGVQTLAMAKTSPTRFKETMSHEITHLLQYQFRRSPALPRSFLNRHWHEAVCEVFTLARVGDRFPRYPSHLNVPPTIRIADWELYSTVACRVARRAAATWFAEERDPVRSWEDEFAREVVECRVQERVERQASARTE